MRIFNRDKKRTGTNNLLVSLLWTGLPIAFIAGLMLGYQLWGKEPVAANDRRVEIPIDQYDAVRGPKDAKVVMVEFTDYQCPYCQRYYNETFNQIIAAYGDQIQYVLKDLPLESIHPEAVPASIAAHCAGEQDAFWEYHGLLFSMELGLGDQAYQAYAQTLQLDTDEFNDCLSSGRYSQVFEEDIDILTANNVGLSTPTFFINGRYIAGAQAFATFAQVIEAELAAVE